MELTMVLDHPMLEKVVGYLVYRGEEIDGDRPIVDGLYLRRGVVGSPPPETMRITLDWE